MPPKVLAKPKDDRSIGVLPVSAAARAAPSKSPATRLKLEIRRLPPALTLSEFEDTLGDEWRLRKGKVDWREYRQGKLKSPGKLPEQSRCYLHLASEPMLKGFEQRFLSVTFHDQAGTHKHPELKHLPPTLGFAPYQRTPQLHAKPKADNRQGTIDQDAEFIAFLEAETQPIVKAAAIDAGVTEKEDKEVVKSTPLIDDLRERKANKAKAAATKAEKKKAVDEDKGSKKGEEDAKGGKDAGGKQQKIEQASKEAAKVLHKQVASKQQQNAQAQQSAKAASPARPKKVASSPKPQNAAPAQPAGVNANAGPASPAPQRAPPGRQRGNADGIKKMLQKDLGIRPKPARDPPVPQPPAPDAAATSPPPATPATPAPTQQTVPKNNTSPSSATKAYLKHANPSQGMTEVLIQQALATYGEMSHVTIDPRKGTAIAVFKDSEGLKKALEARKVPVAQGAVEVLEFKEWWR